jgi:hypothetical protein
MERTIGHLLRFGVIFSSAIVLLGAICFLHRHSYETRSGARRCPGRSRRHLAPLAIIQ